MRRDTGSSSGLRLSRPRLLGATHTCLPREEERDAPLASPFDVSRSPPIHLSRFLSCSPSRRWRIVSFVRTRSDSVTHLSHVCVSHVARSRVSISRKPDCSCVKTAAQRSPGSLSLPSPLSFSLFFTFWRREYSPVYWTFDIKLPLVLSARGTRSSVRLCHMPSC